MADGSPMTKSSADNRTLMPHRGDGLTAHAERLEARGSRGEACIIIRTWSGRDSSNAGCPSGERGQPSYRLATGERLNPTDESKVFETLDGTRRFTFR